MRVRGIQSGFDFLKTACRLRYRRKPVLLRRSATLSGRRFSSGIVEHPARSGRRASSLTTLLGTLLGIGRFSTQLRWCCGSVRAYVEAFRNVPVLLQLLHLVLGAD
jgi:ABC-type amino acid transport system permease subunit